MILTDDNFTSIEPRWKKPATLMTALLLGLMLVFEPKEPDLMQRPPRDPKEPILTFELVMRTGFVTLILLAGAFGLFLWEQTRGATLAEARTIVVNVIVVVEIFYLLNCRSLTSSVLSIGFFSNPWVLWGSGGMFAAQLAFTYAPFMNRLFHTAHRLRGMAAHSGGRRRGVRRGGHGEVDSGAHGAVSR